jgi:hypothetical protein
MEMKLDTEDGQARLIAAAAYLVAHTQTGQDLLAKVDLKPDATGGYHIPPDLIYEFIDSLSKRQWRILRQLAKDLEIGVLQ